MTGEPLLHEVKEGFKNTHVNNTGFCQFGFWNTHFQKVVVASSIYILTDYLFLLSNLVSSSIYNRLHFDQK